MKRTATYLCIGCPLGCRLEVEEDQTGEIVEVRGFSCKLGKTYAEQEHTAPQRVVTTTVGLSDGLVARLPVRTDKPVPKDKVLDVCRALRTIQVSAPVKMNAVIVANILNSGANVVASRELVSIANDQTTTD